MTKRRMLSVVGLFLLASVLLGFSIKWSNNAKEEREEQQAKETFHIWTSNVSEAGDGYKSSGANISMKGYDGSDYLLEYDDSKEAIYFIFDSDTHLRLCRDDNRYWQTNHSDLVDCFLQLTSGS